MPRLVLIRHAKSGWDDPLLTDHQRPLAPRGIDAAPKIGTWLAAQGIRPDLILCSDAVRTRETWALIAPHLPDAPLRLVPSLYHAAPATILARLREAAGDTVVLLGHNPGIGEFATRFVRTPPDHPGFASYPTAATLIADVPDVWATAAFGTAMAAAFTVPRDL